MGETNGFLKLKWFFAFAVSFVCCSTAVLGGTLGHQINKDGLVKTITYPNGMVSDYEYDSLNQLVRLTHRDACDIILARYEYTRYAGGQLESAAEYDGTEIQWQYDNLNRLIKEDYNAPGTDDDYIHTYVYDLVGNRLKLCKSEDVNVNYSYDIKTDRLTELTAGDISKLYYYDDNGSLIKEADDSNTLRTFTYDLKGRLCKVEIAGGNTVTYKYDSTGYRFEKKINSDEPIKFLIDTENPTGYPQVFQETADSGKTTYIIGRNIIGQAVDSNKPLYYLRDGTGSVRHLVDANCSILESYYYDAYGNLFSRSTANPASKLLYRGGWWDRDLQMYYLQSRYYDPATGLFNRMDEHPGNRQEPQSLHKYVYCQDDPINKIDPAGTFGLPALSHGMYQQSQIRVHYQQAQAPTIAKVAASAMALALGASQIMSTSLDVAGQMADDAIDFSNAQRMVQNFVMEHLSESFSQEDFEHLEGMVSALRRNRHQPWCLYLHYGFRADEGIFRSGQGLKAPSWGTRAVYPTGWYAKYYLAQYEGPPRDAIYIVLPRHYDVVHYGGEARYKQDLYPPNRGNWLKGGGQQWYFPNGTSPGTVFGPIPIPTGSLSDVLR
jgi:RHS repeat-associated protein